MTTSTLYAADLFSAASARDDITVRTRYNAQKKTLLIGATLMVLFGYLGAHRFYAGRMGSGAAQSLITMVSLAALGTWYSVFGMAAVGLWGLCDALLLPKMIADYNQRLMISLGH